MNHETKALSFFSSGHNCAQSVFASFVPAYGIEETLALQLSVGLGAGMGRLQKTCGALTGAMLALGLILKNRSATPVPTPVIYLHVQELAKNFAARIGSTECRDILQLDLTTEEGQHLFKERNYLNTRCANCVTTAVQLLNAYTEQQL